MHIINSRQQSLTQDLKQSTTSWKDSTSEIPPTDIYIYSDFSWKDLKYQLPMFQF